MADVVIIGGGMAGVACASELAKHDVEVLLVDRNDYLQFQPLLYQVASSQLPAEDVARPLSTVFARRAARRRAHRRRDRHRLCGPQRPARHRRATDAPTISSSPPAPNRTSSGCPAPTNTRSRCIPSPDAERLRLHLRAELRCHLHCQRRRRRTAADPLYGGHRRRRPDRRGDRRRGRGTVRGPASGWAARRSRHRCDLVDHGNALLQPFSDKSHKYAHDKLTENGVRVTFGVAVTRVAIPKVFRCPTAAVRATRTVIWGGGESASPIAADTGAQPGRGGRIDVEPDLTVAGFDGVYAIGDVANIPGHARRPHCRSWARSRNSPDGGRLETSSPSGTARPTTPFHYRDKGIMAMIGRNAAVAEIGPHRHQVDGPIAFAAWLGLHAILLSGVHSRVDAFLNWADDYFHHDRSADLELDGTPRRESPGPTTPTTAHVSTSTETLERATPRERY